MTQRQIHDIVLRVLTDRVKEWEDLDPRLIFPLGMEGSLANAITEALVKELKPVKD